MIKNKVVYVDMDGVLVDLQSEIDNNNGKWYPSIFKNPKPIDGAVEAFSELCMSEEFDVYILSTAPWNMPDSWSHKRLWVSKYLGPLAHKRLILSNHKNLLCGDYLIDDRTANGAGEFNGELIQFGTDKFPDWKTVLKHLQN